MDYNSLENILGDTVDSTLLDAIKARADRAELVTLLDAEVQRSASRLQRLRECRNYFSSPVYRLSPEILSQIFFIYAKNTKGLFNLKWTKILPVCKRWYEVGISTPRLWSFVTVQSQDLQPDDDGGYNEKAQDRRDVRRVEAQIVRAGRYPLTLDLTFEWPVVGPKEAYLSMFWDPSSLLSLIITGQREYVIEILRAVSACQHPNLQLLTALPIDFTVDATVADVISLEELSLMAGILGGNTPKLRTLRIYEIPFDWNYAQGLRMLRVCYRREIRVPFGIDDILDALGRSPLLEEVNITLPPSFSPDIVLSRPKLSLAHLASLFLLPPAAVSAQILQGLALPPSADIFVEVEEDSRTPPPDSLSMLAACLGSHICQNDAPTVRSISVLNKYTVGGVVGVSVQCHYKSMTRSSAWSTLSPDISLHAPVLDDAESTSFVDMLRSWPRSTVTQLDMREGEYMRTNWWNILFAQLPALTTIIVRPEYPSAESLVEVLQTRLADRAGRGLLANVVFDASKIERRFGMGASMNKVAAVHARRTIMRALAYCAEATRTDVPMDTLEIINEPRYTRHRVLEPGLDIDWRELYKDLKKGFVYEGTLYSADVGREGVMADTVGLQIASSLLQGFS